MTVSREAVVSLPSTAMTDFDPFLWRLHAWPTPLHAERAIQSNSRLWTTLSPKDFHEPQLLAARHFLNRLRCNRHTLTLALPSKIVNSSLLPLVRPLHFLRVLAHFLFELIRVLADAHHVIVSDLRRDPHVEEVIVEQDHAFLAGGLDVRGDFISFAFAAERFDGVVGHHDFEGGDAAFAVGGGEQQLRNYGDQRRGQLGADLFLLVGREGVHDAVDGFGGAGGVQGGEDDVAGFGGGDGGGDGFQIAHFADQHDVGILAQRTAQRFGEAGHVHADFALSHDALLVRVIIFDGVFDGDDVVGALLVDEVDHRRQRRGFAGAGGADDEHQSARTHADVFDHGRQADLFEREQTIGNLAQDDTDVAAFLKNRHAEAGLVAVGEAEVRAAALAQFLLAALRRHRLHQADGVVGRQSGCAQVAQFTAHANSRRTVYAKMQVGAVVFDHRIKQFGDVEAPAQSAGRRSRQRLRHIAAAAALRRHSRRGNRIPRRAVGVLIRLAFLPLLVANVVGRFLVLLFELLFFALLFLALVVALCSVVVHRWVSCSLSKENSLALLTGQLILRRISNRP